MNIIQIFQQFPTQQDCIACLEAKRWPDKPHCPYCGSVTTAPMQHRHRCYDCHTGFSVTVGTIFHKTKLPLQKWFLAVSLVLNARKSLSALQLSRDIEVNKNTAWRMMMQIRKAMAQRDQRDLLTGIVEMDETHVGGKSRKGKKYDDPDDKPKRGRGTKKTPVVGAVERGGKVSAKATDKDRLGRRHLQAFVRDVVNTDAANLITDEYKGYKDMDRLLPHAVIKHADWYVDGDIHTNTIEGFRALLKRGMFGQFHSVSRKHLQRYVDEFCYRYNLRRAGPMEAFEATIEKGLKI